MDRNIPRLPEASDVLSIPPVTVKLSVSEAEELGRQVHHGVKHPVETKQPEEMVRNLRRNDSMD